MSEQNHPWCRDVSRDEAVRRAEDAAATPEIQHRELPSAVRELQERVARLESSVIPKSASVSPAEVPENKADTMPDDGLRTERVTLEVTHHCAVGLDNWAWHPLLELEDEESVRVVDECCLDRINMGEVIRQRDAAIRERDEALAECERWRRDCRSARDHCTRLAEERDAALDDADGLRARVAELEAAAAANAGGEQEPVAWGMRFPGGYLVPFEIRELAETKTKEANERAFATWGMPDAIKCVPLYAAPQPPRGWLTEEMRDDLDEALEWLNCQTNVFAKRAAAAIATTLARETPPRVVLTGVSSIENAPGSRLLAACDVIRSIASAGCEAVFPKSWNIAVAGVKLNVDGVAAYARSEAGGEVGDE